MIYPALLSCVFFFASVYAIYGHGDWGAALFCLMAAAVLMREATDKSDGDSKR